MVTMSELAKMAGVSQSTVSRVLNGSATVSPEATATVLKWVKKLDFQANLSARALASRKTNLIGLILPDSLNPYFIDIVYHVEKIAAKNGFNIIFCNSDGSSEKEFSIFKSLIARQVEGILIGFTNKDSLLIDKLKFSDIKSVVITQECDRLDSVCISHREGGIIAVRHLIDRGCTRILYIGNPIDDKYYGLIDEIKSQGLTENDLDVIDMGALWCHSSDKSYSNSIKYIKDSKYKGKIGVFTSNDFLALGFLNAAIDLNISVPEKYAVVGFDDTFICEATRPKLTSISQPKEDIGQIAINRLLAKISNRTENNDQENIEITPKLTIRESS